MTRAKEAYYSGRGLRSGLAARYVRLLSGCSIILDIGCGHGEMGAALAPATVYGVDSDPAAVEQASRYEIASCLDVSGGLPYADEMFDAVVAKDILEHLERPWELVAEIRRVIKPGGSVIASVIQARPRRVWADYTHVRGFTEKTARILFEDCGFRVHATWPMGGVPLSNRLGFTDLVPSLLRVPGLGLLWAASWELHATAP